MRDQNGHVLLNLSQAFQLFDPPRGIICADDDCIDAFTVKYRFPVGNQLSLRGDRGCFAGSLRNGIDHHDLYSVAGFLARTKSRLMALSMEDLLGVVDQPNIPGTIDEHPNWRQRLPVALDAIGATIDVGALQAATRERSRLED